jgi:outer membrane biosynthesis protein TonB
LSFVSRNNLAENTPTQLTQDYYECYPDQFSAFLNAIGIASGNTQLAVPLTVCFLLPLVYLVLVIMRQAPPKEEYTNREKQQALEILSILLLRLRDGKSRGVRKNGVLIQLTEELIKAAKEDSGFPDSDDEGDEDDEDSDEDDEDDDDNKKDSDANYAFAEDEKGGPVKKKKPKRVSKKKTAPVTLDSDDEEEAVRESMERESLSAQAIHKKKLKRKSRKISGEGGEQSSAARNTGNRSKMDLFAK